jgi:hypothetical protein
MTVDVARRARRRAAVKNAVPDFAGAGSYPTPPRRPRRGARSTTPAAPASDTALAVAAGSAPPEPDARRIAALPPPSIAPSGSFRSASSFSTPPPSVAPPPTFASPTAPAASFAPAGSLAIGELDQTIFDCPSCSRPLALGARRCPGCKTRLVNGVVLSKVSGFVAVGLAAGLLAGACGGFILGAGRAAAVAPVVAGAISSARPSVGSTGAPSGTPGATATQAATASLPAPTPPSSVPAWTRSALLQVIATNGRLATAAGDLRAALKEPSFDPSAAAQVLRSISAQSVFAQQLADRVAGWPGSGDAGPALVTFYASVHDAAATGLLASVRNASAYRQASIAILKLLDEGPAIDAAVRATALSAGIDLGAAPTAP